MAPLDPTTSKVGFVLTETVAETGIASLVTAVLTWVISRLTVSARIGKLEVMVSRRLDGFQADMLRRQSEIEGRVHSISQELYGAQGDGGMMRSLEQLHCDVQIIKDRTARLDANLELLLHRVP
jgi:hypothetical protein